MLWHRPLGSGFSAIVVDDGKLYTMYRKSRLDEYEYTVVLDAKTGETVWKAKNRAAVPGSTEEHGKKFSGPNATPLILGDRLYIVGRNATLRCLRKTDGKVLWEQRMRSKFGAEIETCGYSPSPLAYNGNIVVPVGLDEGDKREGKSLVAFDRIGGSVVWQSQTFRLNHSSPLFMT